MKKRNGNQFSKNDLYNHDIKFSDLVDGVSLTKRINNITNKAYKKYNKSVVSSGYNLTSLALFPFGKIKGWVFKFSFLNCSYIITSHPEWHHALWSQQSLCFLISFSCSFDARIRSLGLPTTSYLKEIQTDRGCQGCNFYICQSCGVYTSEIPRPKKPQADECRQEQGVRNFGLGAKYMYKTFICIRKNKSVGISMFSCYFFKRFSFF